MDFDNIPVSCAIIKVEKEENTKGVLKDGPRFKVPYQDILKTIEFIKMTLKDFEMENYKIYISGFEIISKNSVWTKQDIVRVLLSEKSRTNKVQQENVTYSK